MAEIRSRMGVFEISFRRSMISGRTISVVTPRQERRRTANQNRGFLDSLDIPLDQFAGWHFTIIEHAREARSPGCGVSRNRDADAEWVKHPFAHPGRALANFGQRFGYVFNYPRRFCVGKSHNSHVDTYLSVFFCLLHGRGNITFISENC